MSQEKTYTQMRKGFIEQFFRIIKPHIQTFEQERINNLIMALLITISSAIIFLVIIFNSINIQSEFLKNVILYIDVIFLFITVKTLPYCKKTFENSIKEQIMPLICSCYGDLQWTQGDYIGDESLLFSSNLIKRSYHSKYDDILYGSYKDVKYEILEVKFHKRNGKYEAVYFQGAIVSIDMNKNFKGNTIIETHRANGRSGIMSLMWVDHEKFDNKELKPTKLEDSKFNEKFDIYTDNEVEARYLITTSFMERLKKMQTAFKTNKIRCAFYNNKLLIGLETNKDLFSICSLFKRVDDPKQFFTMFEEILSIIKLIDHFKLNQKIGL